MTRWLQSAVEQAKATQRWDDLCAAIPYARFMNFGLESDGVGLVVRMAYAPELIGNPLLPALHGGALGALLESAALFQLLYEAEPVVIPRTISLTVDYLRSGEPVNTWARGMVTRRGRRVANVRMEAWQEDPSRPTAAAHGHFLLGPGARPSVSLGTRGREPDV